MMVGKFVIVRCKDAGVHMGTLKAVSERAVHLKAPSPDKIKSDGCFRLFRWRGANTLNEVSLRGVDQEYTRISEPTEEIVLLEACEVLPVTDTAKANLTQPRWGADS